MTKFIVYSIAISKTAQAPKSCCGLINEDSHCSGDPMVGLHELNMHIMQIDGISICSMENIKCDRSNITLNGTLHQTNTIKLDTCISRSGYNINEICTAIKPNNDTKSPGFYTIITLMTLNLIYISFRLISTLWMYLGYFELEFVLKTMACDILLGILSSIIYFVVEAASEYTNESPPSIYNVKELEGNCGTSGIIWTAPFAMLPWYLRPYGIPFFAYILILTIDLITSCMPKKLQTQKLIEITKNIPHIIKTNRRHILQIEMQHIQMRGSIHCTESEVDITANCDYLQRLLSIIEYHDTLRQIEQPNISQRNTFIGKCTHEYEGNILDDVYHIQQHHSQKYQHIQNKLRVKGVLCDNYHGCTSIHRHYQLKYREETGQIKELEDGRYSLFMNILDNVHLILFHLADLGLRFDPYRDKSESKYDSEHDNETWPDFYRESDDRSRKDKQIIAKCSRYASFSKYTIFQGNACNITGSEIPTWIDSVFLRLNEFNMPIGTISELSKYIVEEEYDTDSVIEDMNDTLHCNLRRIFMDERTFRLISTIIQTVKGTSPVFVYVHLYYTTNPLL